MAGVTPWHDGAATETSRRGERAAETTDGQRSFDELGQPLYDVRFCVLDLETTGGSAATDEITEIGAVLLQGGEEIAHFQTLVDPGRPIPPFVTVLTGITHAMVIGAPRVEEALPTFLEFLGDAVIVGHNVRFDLGFLNAAAERLGYGRLRNRSVDTVALARRLVRPEVRNLKLQTLAAHFRSPVTPNHRALEDARATAHVLHGLLERAGTLGVTALEDLLALPTARGSAHFGKMRLTEGLPRRPGVYLFRDRSDGVFYVGKAKNLRTRVRSYFYGDTRRRIADMLRELQRIDHIVCPTELEAEVMELRLIHEHRPRHNRRSKPPRTTQYVKLTSEAYPRLSLARVLKDDGGLYLGPFRSRRHAEQVMWAIWDAAPLRRCTGRPGRSNRRCSFAQMGVALCPCDGTLDEDVYRGVVARVRAGIEEDPHLLLDALRGRMERLAHERRFEEAAWTRDRHRALAMAIARRRRWQALQAAGDVIVEVDGEMALVRQGRLVASWRDHAPLLPTPAAPEDAPPQVPPTVLAAEEADLIWRRITAEGARIVDATGPFALPARPVPTLPRPDRRTVEERAA